ncbi:hypothetical protein [Pukyongiella litopenaei]|uniref:Uncharacterized protein n=1 Tax=Pukyongiella litopenaei TaxID=2605946 RepID=A0A2S0MMP0_9RHOB|nr:hypothetical protein [Pukyongiella litopenaei]AVO37021.1 hypothetical protein C6Y53_04420 [Pukyongiella litopenaei]
MTDRQDDLDLDLDRFWEAARSEARDLPDGLADRVLKDALAVQDARRGGHRAGWGSWSAVAGLAAACAAGFWIGFAPPQNLPDPASLLSSGDDINLLAPGEMTFAMLEDEQ